MSQEWHYVLHQRAAESMDQLPARDRRQVRAELHRLVAFPFAEPDAEIRPANDRPYQIRRVGRLRIVYWLDVFVREVCVVRVEPDR
jgi:mRNA-degrading endonuclease RelE of RelBE toxin-antitoxin system